MSAFFRDPDLQQQFLQDGYVVMPFVSGEVAGTLKQLFTELHPQTPENGFYSSSFAESPEFKQSIFDKVDGFYAEKVAAEFQEVKKLGASFLCKKPGPPGKMPIHQDWTVTDETTGFTVTIWVPLQDVNSHNGAIKVLPGSHRFSNALRGPSLPVIYTEVFPLLEEQLITLEMKAGDAFIFQHNLLHSSHINQSAENRIAITYGLAPEKAELCFYHHHPQDPPNRFEKLSVGDDFFMRYFKTGQRPDFGVSQGFYQQDLSPITEQECKQLLSGELSSLHRTVFEEADPTVQVPTPEFKLFKTETQNRALAQEGYVIFPFLPPSAIEELTRFFFEHHPKTPEGFYASAHAQDLEFRGRMNEKIKAVFEPLMAPILDQVQLLGGSFIAKPKGNGGILPPHADWNISDESAFRSFNLWVPLVDTSVQNGAVQILPYSHAWFDSYRGPGIPNAFEPVSHLLWQSVKPLEMKAGEALLYDHRLVHASSVNHTDELRLACVFGLIPKGAEMRHYQYEAGKVGEYQATVDFHLKGNPAQGAGDLQLLNTLPVDYPLVTPPILLEYLKLRAPDLVPAPEVPASTADRSFWQTYSPKNVVREISHRLQGLFK